MSCSWPSNICCWFWSSFCSKQIEANEMMGPAMPCNQVLLQSKLVVLEVVDNDILAFAKN